jgi:hypothetical protein
VEATAEGTEARLLKGLRRQVTGLPGSQGLAESLGSLRRGRFLETGQKVLLILDQFEQWLHTRQGDENTELVQALRQCDGGRVQGLVLVRDDFWMAATRFMASLEISLVQGHNCGAVDLFDLLHARQVLGEFGRAFSRLPENRGQRTKDQEAFLGQAVAGLAQDGKVIPVRLALFAEMVKGRPWTPATLKEVGGAAGVGVTFLEETFSASTAPPQHRLHQKAAQAMLRALLPEAGMDIKGHTRSQQELLEASGYAGRPKDFDDLIRILDSEVRLITPTDLKGVHADASPEKAAAGGRYYQLTHDYLVHSLRDWLTRKQWETRRGRAELRLAERAALWHNKPENRQLPSWWEWFAIRLLTRRHDWTPPQRRLMGRAGRYHALRGVLLGFLLALGGGLTFGALRAREFAERGHLIDYQVRRLVEGDVLNFAVSLDRLRDYPGEARAALHIQLNRSMPPTARQRDKEALARQQSQAAVALLHLERAEWIWPLFRQGEDPTCRTYLIHRCAALQVDPAVLAHRLLGEEEKDPQSVRVCYLRSASTRPTSGRRGCLGLW